MRKHVKKYQMHFQVSLKKGVGGDARIGKITTFINKNYVQGKEGNITVYKGQEVEIVVEGGVVVEVNGLPSDWTYHITDNDCVLEVEDE